MNSSPRGLSRKGHSASIVAVAVLSASSLAAEERFSLKPSVSAAQVYDDNLFSSASTPQADSLFRISPALDVRYARPSLDLVGTYAFDAERYFSHAELDAAFARSRAAATLRYAPAPRLRLSVTLSSLDTTTPQDLNGETALAAERARASRYAVTPAVTYQVSARAEVIGSSECGWSTLVGGRSIQDCTTGATAKLQTTPVDHAVVVYQARRFSFDGAAAETSHVFAAGWTRRLTSVLDATVQAGPRVTGSRVRPEVSASLGRRVKGGDLAFEYTRSESAALGQTAPIDVERFTATLTARPGRLVELRVAPSATRDVARDSGRRAIVYAMEFGATTPISAWLSASAGYRVTSQRGTVGLVDSTVEHGVFSLSLVATTPR